MLASRERRETSVALTSTLHWFETDVLAEEQNYHALTRLNADLIRHAAARSPSRRVTLDIRKPRPWHTRAVRVQRSLRGGVLSPALRLQPRGRLPGRETPAGQRPQRPGLG